MSKILAIKYLLNYFCAPNINSHSMIMVSGLSSSEQLIFVLTVFKEIVLSQRQSWHFLPTRRMNGGKHRGKITASPFVGGRKFWHQWGWLEVYLKYWHRIGSCSHSAWKVYYWQGLPAAASWKWEKTFGQLG